MTQIFSVLCSLLLALPLTVCSSSEVSTNEQIHITTDEGNVIIFELNDSTAAEALYSQLPLSVSVENYGDNQKIFYSPSKLDTSDTPLAEGRTGTLAYYEPWGNVAIYYGECSGADGLYELGNTIDGAEYILEMEGEIYIDIISTSASSSKYADMESTPKSSVMQSTSTPETSTKEDESVKSIQVIVGNQTFTATLAENAAVQSFVELMKTAPIVINMSDYSGFEKVGSLGTNLPTSNSNTTTQAGDIVLYNGSQIAIFYGSNTWSYTSLGRIDDLSGWEEALGSSDVTVTFSIE